MSDIVFQAQIPGVFAEETLLRQDFSMARRHLHESTELYFMLEGERYYFIEQDTYHVKQGMAVLINRDQIHKTSMVSGSTGHRRFLLQLDPSVLDGMFFLPEIPNVQSLGENYWGVAEFSEEDWQQALEVIRMLKRELQHREPESSAMAKLLVMQLLALFVRSRRQQEMAWRKNRIPGHPVHTGIHQTVHEVAIYLQNHSSEPCSLDMLANRFYISRAYLTRMFKSVTGFTVTEYLTVCRIRKARILLDETKLSITEIAARTGFGNITYFEKVFKDMTHMTPLKYRNRSGKSGNNGEGS